jgi:hypothetical protein
MRTLLCALLLASAPAFAANPPKPSYSYFYIGESAPKPASNGSVLDNGGLVGITRRAGGEWITLNFLDNDRDQNAIRETVAGLRITAYSKSGKGSVLVRAVSFGDAGTTSYLKTLRGKLANGEHHDVTFPAPKAVSQVAFQLEGFGNNDASVAIEITFTKDVRYAFRADFDYVNPPSDGGDNGNEGPSDPNDPYGGSEGGFAGPGSCTNGTCVGPGGTTVCTNGTCEGPGGTTVCTNGVCQGPGGTTVCTNGVCQGPNGTTVCTNGTCD